MRVEALVMAIPAAGRRSGLGYRGLLRNIQAEEISVMTGPGWYYKEQIEHELERLGAQTWRYQDDRAHFRDEGKAGPADVELASDVYGAVLGQARAVLEALGQLQDGVGDDRIAETLFRESGFERRRSQHC